MRLAYLFPFLQICAVAMLAGASIAQTTDLNTALGEQVTMLPSDGITQPELELTYYKPPGDGPFPVVLINHGRSRGDAKMQPPSRPALAAREFVQRGYVVAAPMRQGFSQSGGYEIAGGCNVESNGEQQAISVRRTLGWLAKQAWADVSRNVVMGQSHGGLTTLAYGIDPHPGTKLLVNFAGGLRQESCTGWEHNLIRAIGNYGGKSKLPSIWFYGDNDSYFQPFVFKGAHERYVAAGGKAELVEFGPFGSDAHGMFGTRAGLPIWLPKVLNAMKQAGLPTTVSHPLAEAPDMAPPPASNFAAVDDLTKVPLRSDRAREGYERWLRADQPRAFAIHPTLGSWASTTGGARPMARALANCDRFAAERLAASAASSVAAPTQKVPCRLYAVDDKVVWTTSP